MVGANSSQTFSGFTDPNLYEFVKNGSTLTESGISVSPEKALKNPTVLRCVSLISSTIGSLPLHLKNRETKEIEESNHIHTLLHRRPNEWQTAFEFRSMMQQKALMYGDAYALKIQSRGKITQLIPLNGCTVEQGQDFSLSYTVTRKDGSQVKYKKDKIFHLRGALTENGFTGVSLVKQAAEAIAISLYAERNAARMFAKGIGIGGFIEYPDKLTQDAFENLQDSVSSWSEPENEGRWKVLEGGGKATPNPSLGKDQQSLEQRGHQIEEIARVFGVPRTLLMLDDTSWGTGIEATGQGFVRFTLSPWFEAWQQAIERDILSDEESDKYQVKFNAGGLLRGSVQEQAEYFTKALGSGGHPAWMTPNEVRDASDMPKMKTENDNIDKNEAIS